jgi:predicted metalloendopeptidase
MTLHDADRDLSADPGDDFYRFANGGWLDANPIPPGFGAWGSFEEIHTRNEAVLHDLLVHAAASPTNDLDRLLGDYFASGMDTTAVDAAGLTAIAPFLEAIAEITSHGDVLAILPSLHGSGIPAFFMWGVTVDHDDSTRNLLWLVQSGLGLPDRDSYDGDSDAAVSLRSAYVAHVAAQLVNTGTPALDAAAGAAGVLKLETRLAATQLRAEERRDPGRTLNRHDLAQLTELAPELDLPGYVVAIGAGGAETVNVQSPAYLAALHSVITGTDLAILRAYLTFHVVRSTSDTLPSAIDDEAFSFYGRRIEGKQEQRDRYKRVVGALGDDMGEALGQRFVAECFPASAKDRAVAMVAEIVAEMRASLESRAWMSDATREQALAKLASLQVKIGYPDTWRDWSGLRIERSSYAANRLAATHFELDRQLTLLAEPVDRAQWEMPPHTVNAYYHPTRNEIVFPAGILQPPMFDPAADDAVNFGGIGTVIAHEITHGFDDSGRRFDSSGAFRDWWTEADQEHFTALAERLVTQFDDYVAIDDVHVNGRLTLGENIADLGGVTLAQRAHARVSAGSEPIDGLTPAQRFFLAAATVWRGHTSEELARTLAQVDSHSPRRFRVVGPFSNLDAFQDAFGLDDDAPALRPRPDRIVIW